MVQAAQQQDADEYVTKGEFREAIASLETRMTSMETRLMEAITYTNRLNELVLDDIKPGWRDTMKKGVTT